ncbi:MAG: hypothetical protein ACI8QZ_003331, partial [Chlamydiales bacterium]
MAGLIHGHASRTRRWLPRRFRSCFHRQCGFTWTSQVYDRLVFAAYASHKCSVTLLLRDRLRTTTLRSLLLVVTLLGIGATRPAAQAPERSQGDLVPDTTVRGPVLPLEFPEIHVGIAEYREGPTGTTVFFFPEPVMAAIDVRGGAPGVVNSEALRIPYEAAYTNAICFSGG